MKARILSTKLLEPEHKTRLLRAGCSLVEKNFIQVRLLNFDVSGLPSNLIFTSKNAVAAVLQHPEVQQIRSKSCYCVGNATAHLLQTNGFNVKRTEPYGVHLARFITENIKEEEFLFFCGKRRHSGLPEHLAKHKVNFQEVHVYETELKKEKISGNFEGILFFSPSAVESFFAKNAAAKSRLFCLGKTTAAQARKYGDQVVTATYPSISSLLVQVIKTFGDWESSVKKRPDND